MSFDPVETVKLIGAIAGLLSGGFLIYDRLVRARPLIGLARHRSCARMACCCVVLGGTDDVVSSVCNSVLISM
jgi:hypothetical protein